MLEGATALLERQDKSADSLTTKVVGNHKNKTPSEGMGFCFWNDAGRFELTASTCAKRVKFRGEAGFLRMAMPFAGCREASSSLVARGRVIEREWGNPQRFPPHTPPSLRYARVRTTKPEGNHKKKHHPSGWCFVFGMPRAGLNSLPRPARSASNQEVRQGSCEWLCHSRDAG